MSKPVRAVVLVFFTGVLAHADETASEVLGRVLRAARDAGHLDAALAERCSLLSNEGYPSGLVITRGSRLDGGKGVRFEVVTEALKKGGTNTTTVSELLFEGRVQRVSFTSGGLTGEVRFKGGKAELELRKGDAPAETKQLEWGPDVLPLDVGYHLLPLLWDQGLPEVLPMRLFSSSIEPRLYLRRKGADIAIGPERFASADDWNLRLSDATGVRVMTSRKDRWETTPLTPEEVDYHRRSAKQTAPRGSVAGAFLGRWWCDGEMLLEVAEGPAKAGAPTLQGWVIWHGTRCRFSAVQDGKGGWDGVMEMIEPDRIERFPLDLSRVDARGLVVHTVASNGRRELRLTKAPVDPTRWSPEVLELEQTVTYVDRDIKRDITHVTESSLLLQRASEDGAAFQRHYVRCVIHERGPQSKPFHSILEGTTFVIRRVDGRLQTLGLDGSEMGSGTGLGGGHIGHSTMAADWGAGSTSGTLDRVSSCPQFLRDFAKGVGYSMDLTGQRWKIEVTPGRRSCEVVLGNGSSRVTFVQTERPSKRAFPDPSSLTNLGAEFPAEQPPLEEIGVQRALANARREKKLLVLIYISKSPERWKGGVESYTDEIRLPRMDPVRGKVAFALRPFDAGDGKATPEATANGVPHTECLVVMDPWAKPGSEIIGRTTSTRDIHLFLEEMLAKAAAQGHPPAGATEGAGGAGDNAGGEEAPAKEVSIADGVAQAKQEGKLLALVFVSRDPQRGGRDGQRVADAMGARELAQLSGKFLSVQRPHDDELGLPTPEAEAHRAKRSPCVVLVDPWADAGSNILVVVTDLTTLRAGMERAMLDAARAGHPPATRR